MLDLFPFHDDLVYDEDIDSPFEILDSPELVDSGSNTTDCNEEFLDDVINEAPNKQEHCGNDPSFGSSHYTDAEISKLRDDVNQTEYTMKCRENDVRNWESKVSLNNTKEHIENGDYANALRHLKDAEARYRIAKSAYESAKSKLNNAL